MRGMREQQPINCKTFLRPRGVKTIKAGHGYKDILVISMPLTNYNVKNPEDTALLLNIKFF